MNYLKKIRVKYFFIFQNQKLRPAKSETDDFKMRKIKNVC